MKQRGLFSPIKSEGTLKNQTLELLTEAILSGKIKPGEKLNESHLARQLSVSRAPVREALQQLQEQGLAVSIPRRGVFVVSLDEEDIQKIISLRQVVEAEALRIARRNMTPQASRILTQMLERMERLDGAPPPEQSKADLQFHRAIWELTENEYFQKILNSLTALMLANALLTIYRAEKRRVILFSHRPLLDFVLGTSETSAEEIMRAHLALSWGDPARSSSFRSEPSPQDERKLSMV